MADHFMTFHHASHGALSIALTQGMGYVINSKNPDPDFEGILKHSMKYLGRLRDGVTNFLKY